MSKTIKDTQSNKELIAMQWATGLLTDEEKKSIVIDDDLQKMIAQWQKKLIALHHFAPLSKNQQKQIWQNIKKQIRHEKTNIWQTINQWRYTWQLAIPILLALAIVSVYLPNNVTQKPTIDFSQSLTAHKDMAKQRIVVRVKTVMPIPTNKVCVLWLKNADKSILLAQLTGNDTEISMPISQPMLAMLDNAQVIVSLEDKNTVVKKPSQIDYVLHWST